MLIDEQYLLFIIFLIDYVLASFFSMSLERYQPPRKTIRDWLAHTEKENRRREAARAVQNYQLEIPHKGHGHDLGRSQKCRANTAGRPERRLGEDDNLESEEEALQVPHDMGSF